MTDLSLLAPREASSGGNEMIPTMHPCVRRAYTSRYWKEDTAPEIPQKVFGEYLRGLYNNDIKKLNKEWGTEHERFEDIPLEKSKVRAPFKVFVGAEAWEAMDGKKKETRFPVEVHEPDPNKKYMALVAPFYETHGFFDWYYQKFCDMATEVYRAGRNPVPLTIMSAPGGFYPDVDVYNFKGQGAFYPKENSLRGNAVARRDYGDIPGFSGAMWTHHDLLSLWNCVLYSSILSGNTHMDYWVDVPLNFNADITHTRASFRTKALRKKLHLIEPILLHKRFGYTKELGIYIPEQPLARGLAETLGFKLLNTSQKSHTVKRKGAARKITVNIDSDVLSLQDVTLESRSWDKVLDKAEDVQVLAQYDDGIPLIMTRSVGRGRILYLNMMYNRDNWYPVAMSDKDFLSLFRDLRKIYLGTYEQVRTKHLLK